MQLGEDEIHFAADRWLQEKVDVNNAILNERRRHAPVAGGLPHPVIFLAAQIHGDFHKVIGQEARLQILRTEGRLPDLLVACVGGGSNAIGLFYAFLQDAGVKMLGVEAGGRGHTLGEHAARLAAAGGFTGARPGVLQGTYTFVLQTADGQIATTHSVSAGLDYPSIGPEHAWLHDQQRSEYTSVSDADALAAARTLAKLEGIIPALESSHAVAEAMRRAPGARDKVYIVNLSGRGDKDIDIYRENMPELDV